jgi:hypothetical protein
MSREPGSNHRVGHSRVRGIPRQRLSLSRRTPHMTRSRRSRREGIDARFFPRGMRKRYKGRK